MALGILDHSDCKASILTIAKGPQVWILLWKLSNTAIEGTSVFTFLSLPLYIDVIVILYASFFFCSLLFYSVLLNWLQNTFNRTSKSLVMNHW